MRFVLRLIIPLFILFSCTEDKSVEPEPESELILIHPNGGEQLTAGNLDTIKISNYQLYDSLSFYYTLDNGWSWFPIEIIENLDGLYIWQLPWANSTNVKIRILAYAQGTMYIFESDSLFQIIGPQIKIIEPSSSSMFTDPKSIRISWNTTIPFDRHELYYSKYSDEVIYYGNPDNKIVYSSDWILLDENIDGNLREYNWENPYLFSNKVQIKLVGFLENEEYKILSDVFTVKLDEILFEERQYLEKLSVGNRWVYKITQDYYGSDLGNYLLVKEVINQLLVDGKKYYEIEKKTIRDTISLSVVSVQDRSYYSPAYILQNGDVLTKEYFDAYSGNWGIYMYHTSSCKVHDEEVFSENVEIREYNEFDSGSGISSETTKRTKDIGMYNKHYDSEGFNRRTILIGALIDGVVYGDTTVVGL